MSRPGRIPTHRVEMYVPGEGTVVISETYPVGKSKIRGYCKYCYTTHRNWWKMRPEDYDTEDALLCGNCEHCSLKDWTQCFPF